MSFETEVISVLLGGTGVSVASAAIAVLNRIFQEKKLRAALEKALDEANELHREGNQREANAVLHDFEIKTGARITPRTDSDQPPSLQEKTGSIPRTETALPRVPRRHSGLPFLAALLVFLVFAISLGTLWALTHMGGPIEASVKATLDKAGGNILIVGGGLFGAFFAIAFMAFAAIYTFIRKF